MGHGDELAQRESLHRRTGGGSRKDGEGTRREGQGCFHRILLCFDVLGRSVDKLKLTQTTTKTAFCQPFGLDFVERGLKIHEQKNPTSRR